LVNSELKRTLKEGVVIRDIMIDVYRITGTEPKRNLWAVGISPEFRSVNI